jgi:RHS repeat-associated protein
VVSDKKEFVGSSWRAYVLSAQDYYPFGMSMPGRKHSGGTYRYGFNGKETDSETGIQDYGMRWYLPNIARFASVDPLTKQYPWYTPYQFAGNTPIFAVDLDGLEIYGYNNLQNDPGYRRVITVLTATKLWDKLLNETFASASQGDIISPKNGIFANANISLQFELDGTLPDGVLGLASINVIKGNQAVPLLSATDFQEGDKIRIHISLAPLSVVSAANDDLPAQHTNDVNMMWGIETISHEFLIHVEPNANKVKEFMDGKIDFNQLKEWYQTSVDNQNLEESEANAFGIGAYRRIFVEGHKQIRDRSNQNYESLLDAVEQVLGQSKTSVKGVKDTQNPYDSHARVSPCDLPVGAIPYPYEAKSPVGIFEVTLKSFFREMRRAAQEHYTGQAEPQPNR